MKISYVKAVTLYKRGYRILRVSDGMTFKKVSEGIKVSKNKPFLFHIFKNKGIEDFISNNDELEVIEP